MKSQRPKKLDIVGIAEIAELSGASKSSVCNWIKSHKDFPEPVASLKAGNIYWRSEVVSWLLIREAKPELARYLKRQKHTLKAAETSSEEFDESAFWWQRDEEL